MKQRADLVFHATPVMAVARWNRHHLSVRLLYDLKPRAAADCFVPGFAIIKTSI
jgi:hypothetical protein